MMIEWTLGFDRARVEVTTCVLRSPGELGRQLQAEGVPLTFFGDGMFNPRTILKLVRVIRHKSIDVLHLQGYGASAFGRIAGMLTGTPTIVHVHASYNQDGNGYPWYVQLVDRLLARTTDKAIAISESVKRFAVDYMGFSQEAVEVVPNPTPRFAFGGASDRELDALRGSYGLAPDTPVIGATSRLFHGKGIHVLVDAFAEITRSFPEARLLIVGDGPELESLQSQACELAVRDQVIFAGFRRDVAAHLRLFTVTVVPSVHEEAFALSAVESFAAGVPVIGTRTGGLQEVVQDGINGLLVPPGDSEAMADALARILRSSDLRAELAASCPARAEYFSMDRFADRMESHYRQLLRTEA